MLNDVPYSCSNFHEDLKKMKLFLDGIAQTIRTSVARSRKNEPRQGLTLGCIFQYSKDQDDTYKEQRDVILTSTLPYLESRTFCVVPFAEEIFDHYLATNQMLQKVR